jgi:hypothetical protein
MGMSPTQLDGRRDYTDTAVSQVTDEKSPFADDAFHPKMPTTSPRLHVAANKKKHYNIDHVHGLDEDTGTA